MQVKLNLDFLDDILDLNFLKDKKKNVLKEKTSMKKLLLNFVNFVVVLQSFHGSSDNKLWFSIRK